jgi:hypothetical protein
MHEINKKIREKEHLLSPRLQHHNSGHGIQEYSFNLQMFVTFDFYINFDHSYY